MCVCMWVCTCVCRCLQQPKLSCTLELSCNYTLLRVPWRLRWWPHSGPLAGQSVPFHTSFHLFCINCICQHPHQYRHSSTCYRAGDKLSSEIRSLEGPWQIHPTWRFLRFFSCGSGAGLINSLIFLCDSWNSTTNFIKKFINGRLLKALIKIICKRNKFKKSNKLDLVLIGIKNSKNYSKNIIIIS